MILRGKTIICKEFMIYWIYFGEIALENRNEDLRQYQHYPLKL